VIAVDSISVSLQRVKDTTVEKTTIGHPVPLCDRLIAEALAREFCCDKLPESACQRVPFR